MSHNCRQQNSNYIPGLDKMPVLKYQKDPVGTLNELYARYPDGGEYGWYAFVISAGTFAWWDTEEKEWKTIDPGKLESMLGYRLSDLKEGDVPVWDEEDQKFVIINMSIIGENEY